MVSFIEAGMISFRTKCLTLERAASFARALNANRRFRDVEIRESRRAKGEVRWFVCFLPSNPVRETVLLEGQQSAREARAAEQSFTIVADPDHDYLHCYSHHTQETYEVSIAGATCSCPDFQYRLSGTGVLCKHLVASADAVRTEAVGEFQQVPARKEIGTDMRWVNDQAAFEQVFG